MIFILIACVRALSPVAACTAECTSRGEGADWDDFDKQCICYDDSVLILPPEDTGYQTSSSEEEK